MSFRVPVRAISCFISRVKKGHPWDISISSPNCDHRAMPIGTQSVTGWKAVITTLHVVALSFTAFRIFVRYQMQRLWWDDYLAFLPLVMDSIHLVLFWQGLKQNFLSSVTDTFHGFFFVTFVHFTVLWSSRIILALSLARLFPPRHFARRGAFALAAFFFISYVITEVVGTVTCLGPGIRWYNIQVHSCKRTAQGYPIGGVVAVSLDLSADVFLVALSVSVLWHIKLPPYQRRLILTTVSASILTLLSVLAFLIFWFSGLDLGPQVWLLIPATSHLEAATSLIVCNLQVVVLYAYRVALRRRTGVSAPDELAITLHPEDHDFSRRVSTESGLTRDRRNPRGRMTITSEQITAITFTDVMTEDSREYNLAPLATSDLDPKVASLAGVSTP
ncbi:hypothetical protein B0H34DRAFT_734551 [Crassisporium funariophilum]|nr:hypothetical protein B0H34DRAFT_734551 [Crassisporium funariophilum]